MAEAPMMGWQTSDQGASFYEFHLKDRVPEGHLLRRINAVIAPVLAGLHQNLAPFTAQPAILNRSGADDPDAYHWLFARRPCMSITQAPRPAR
jgi:hypothetical protein